MSGESINILFLMLLGIALGSFVLIVWIVLPFLLLGALRRISKAQDRTNILLTLIESNQEQASKSECVGDGGREQFIQSE